MIYLVLANLCHSIHTLRHSRPRCTYFCCKLCMSTAAQIVSIHLTGRGKGWAYCLSVLSSSQDSMQAHVVKLQAILHPEAHEDGGYGFTNKELVARQRGVMTDIIKEVSIRWRTCMLLSKILARAQDLCLGVHLQCSIIPQIIPN